MLSPGYSNKLFIPYPTVATYVDEVVAAVIRSGFMPETIVAPAGGGLIPASMVQYALYKKWGIKTNIFLLYVKAYKDGVRKDAVHIDWTYSKRTPPIAHACLIVDDICDTGDSLRAILNYVPEAKTGVLIDKPAGRLVGNPDPTYVGHRLGPANNSWVEFPWERQWKEAGYANSSHS